MVTDEMRAKIDAVMQGNQGGYDDDWAVANVDGEDCVIIATLNHDGEPQLDIQSVTAVLAKHDALHRDNTK